MNWRWRKRHGRKEGNCPHGRNASSECRLHSFCPGSILRVCGMTCCCKTRSRLASMGLMPGSQVKVLANPGNGPLLVSMGEVRLMLEQTIAQEVLVQPV